MTDSRPLVNNQDILGAAPFDWSPDNTWIAAGLHRRDGTNQIALVDARTGALRILKSLDWKSPEKIFFSPDGRFIAYDLMTRDDRNEREVYVMAADGSRETTVVAHPSQNVVLGWSPDGRHLLFASDRSGSFGMWAIPIGDGAPKGPAVLLKPDIATAWSLGLTPTGTMYVWKYASPVLVQASTIDLKTGKLTSSPSNFQQFIGSRGRPEWSPDGNRLAYQSCNPLGAGPCQLWIRSIDTGHQREVKLKLGYFFFPSWSPDGRELLVRGRDLRGRNNGLYRIDIESGEATLVSGSALGQSQPKWAADGKHVHYRRGSSVIERNLASGDERELVRIAHDTPGEIAVSPDGRHVAYLARQKPGSYGLFIIPIAGGTSQLLLAAEAPERLMYRFDWTADGAAIAIATRHDDTANQALWMVPIDGGKPRRLDVDINNWLLGDGFRFDRAGKRVAFVAAAGKPGLEIRALENFLPR
jgi:Tol biopolymer transport system component